MVYLLLSLSIVNNELPMQTCSINGIRLPFLSSDSLPNIYTLSARFLLNSNNVNEVFFSLQFFIRIMFRNHAADRPAGRDRRLRGAADDDGCLRGVVLELVPALSVQRGSGVR